MITRKLAVPLINEKILQQAEHCYIVASGISEPGFDFVRSRLAPKCKIDLVTGLDRPVSPSVLRRILNNYSERITVRIYNRNALNANMYLFDLPFRKSLAYIGSGGLTMDGLKDQEELFWKIVNPKEIESLLSWFTSFYEFGTPLTAQLVDSYEPVYHAMVQREIVSMREKEIAMASALINWDSINFRNQFFQREDFDAIRESQKAGEKVREKLLGIQEKVGIEFQRKGLYPVHTVLTEIEETILREVFISFSNSPSGFTPGFMRIDVGVSSSWFFVRLRMLGNADETKERMKFLEGLTDDDFRNTWFAAVKGLSGYAIEVAGKRRPVESFAKDVLLIEWLKAQLSEAQPVTFERRFFPGDPKIRLDTIKTTFLEEVLRLNEAFATTGGRHDQGDLGNH